MPHIRTHLAYLAIIAALAISLFIALKKPVKTVETVKYKRDTITIVKTDTVTFTKVVEVEKEVVDTLYVKSEEDSAPIPISRYRFFKENEYDITALGYNVSLPCITVFPKTITNNITTTVEKEVLVTNYDIYLGGGIWRLGQEWVPNIGATIKTPQNFLFGANLGFASEGLIVGGTIQYKITHNK